MVKCSNSYELLTEVDLVNRSIYKNLLRSSTAQPAAVAGSNPTRPLFSMRDYGIKLGLFFMIVRQEPVPLCMFE